MDWVGFPGLGFEKIFLPDHIFKIFGLTIGLYAVIFSLAVVMGLFCSWCLAEKMGVLKSSFFDVVTIGLICGIFGARLYYIVFNFSQYFKNETIWQNLFELINLREGGIAVYGGLIFSVFSGVLVCRFKKVKVLPMLDLASIGFPVGQSIGRWGNFFNVEAYGSKTSLPWGMVSNKIPSYLQPVHPTFFYESVWCGLIFVFLILFFKHRKFDGEFFCIYLALYSFERFFVEGLRTDSLMLFQTGVRVSQFLSLVFFIVAVVGLRLGFKKLKHRPSSLFAETEEFKKQLMKSKLS